MLIVGDLSGIQDFLFDVRETGGKQAASLRVRSLRIQLITECIARRVLWMLDPRENDCLIYCAAGKFAIDAKGIASAASVAPTLDAIRADVESYLLAETHGRLRFALVEDETAGTAVARNDAANAALQRGKLRPWATRSGSVNGLVVSSIFDLNVENTRDVKLGEKLKDAKTIELAPRNGETENAIAGVSFRFTTAPPVPPSTGRLTLSLDRLARHTPRNRDGSQMDFVELANRSRGAAMLGVLKADADSLGTAVRKRLAGSPSFAPLRQFSEQLDRFFGGTLGADMAAPGSRWNDLYTIFAGGDDLLVVGPWDVAIDFANHVRELFTRAFKADDLTISAGCAIVKPRFPIRLAARQADELLDRAKAGTKDQFAALGDAWRWAGHVAIIDAGKQLANWTDAGDIQRGWLHTLLELALLRRGEHRPRDGAIIPEMASSRLHYHVARNWPKSGPARQWIDARLRPFDDFQTTADPLTLHLPAILRYAMLATRSQGDER